MTNKEKAEKNTALASEPAEFSGELADDDLKQVAGGGIANPEAAGLSAYGVNGILTVKGLTAGEPFSVHN
ncbi:MAG: hypothetical protein LBK23_07695, partial [Oscillospiraceae bacterium]|nr:hypothetical protein [Oscillospiraceae bacterium]